jgi:hypothetical protein
MDYGSQVYSSLCMYGTSFTGAGYLGVRFPHGQSFGTGDPVKHRTFTEAIWHGLADLRDAGVTAGLVRVFDSGGERMATVDMKAAVNYAFLTWQPAPVYTISADELIAAADARSDLETL